RIPPEGDHDIHEFDGRRAVQHDRLAIGLNIVRTPRPNIRLAERSNPADAMPKPVPDQQVRGLLLVASITVLMPGLRELAIGLADVGYPRLPISDLQANNAPGQGDPFLSIISDRLRGFIKAALRLADLICDVADVHKALAVKLRPVVEDADDVGARA